MARTGTQLTHGEGPPGRRPHIVVQLKPGWTFSRRNRQFEKEDTDPVRIGAVLPPRTRILAQHPDLADDSLAEMSAEEQTLALFYNLVLPKGVDAGRYLNRVRSCPCVDDAWIAPMISLP